MCVVLKGGHILKMAPCGLAGIDVHGGGSFQPVISQPQNRSVARFKVPPKPFRSVPDSSTENGEERRRKRNHSHEHLSTPTKPNLLETGTIRFPDPAGTETVAGAGWHPTRPPRAALSTAQQHKSPPAPSVRPTNAHAHSLTHRPDPIERRAPPPPPWTRRRRWTCWRRC